MKPQRLLECLDADYARLRQVAQAADLAAPVPSCPGWTVDDLVRHVAMVYLHKAECMRVGRHPDDWPPDISGEQTLAALERGYQDLSSEFAAREPGSPTYTWFGPDQTVGFWIRRMAQETVIHRVDAELGAGVSIAEIPEDLALDGIDELVHAFLEYGSATWPDDFEDVLAGADGRAVRVNAAGASWVIRPTKAGVQTRADEIAAEVSGAPTEVLLWLWNRAGEGSVKVSGDVEAVTLLKRVLVAGTA